MAKTAEECSTRQSGSAFVVILTINLLLSALLWFGFVTNVEFSLNWVNAFFPFVVLAVTVWTYRKRHAWSRWQRVSMLTASFPGFAGSFSYALVIGLLCLMFLPAAFWVAEQASAFRAQRLASPDGSRTVDVIFVPVGAYAGGWGRVEVYERWDWAPFLRRQVVVLQADDEIQPGDRVMEWTDSDTLRLRIDGTEVAMDSVDWRNPSFVLIITSLYDLLTS